MIFFLCMHPQTFLCFVSGKKPLFCVCVCVSVNLLALGSFFVSMDGGGVTLVQPCHRTARCQSPK